VLGVEAEGPVLEAREPEVGRRTGKGGVLGSEKLGIALNNTWEAAQAGALADWDQHWGQAGGGGAQHSDLRPTGISAGSGTGGWPQGQHLEKHWKLY
jgi:hypothetical protein